LEDPPRNRPVSPIFTQLKDQALRLSPEEREELALELFHSLESEATDPEIEKAHVAEAERRLAAYRRGEIEAVDIEEVFKDLESGRRP
jgi:putative addiction module component (TIGR02574 family)